MATQTIEIEVYEARDGSLRINIGGASYALLDRYGVQACDRAGELPGEELEPRQLAQVRRGDYGPVAQAWAAAHDEREIVPRFAYRGIMNALGDHAEVSPAFNPHPAPPGTARGRFLLGATRRWAATG